MEKIRVSQKVDFDKYKLTGSLSEVIKNLQRIQNKLPEGVDPELDIDADEYYGGITWEATLKYFRPETDEEYNLRQRRAKQAETRERLEYERLKQKFGDA